MNNKILRVNEDIKRELANLLREIKDPRIKNQGMITITAVDTSGDLGYAKVYISVYKKTPNETLQAQKEFLSGLKSASGHLRYELGKKLSLRHTPELKFILDESIERGARISSLLRDYITENDVVEKDEKADGKENI